MINLEAKKNRLDCTGQELLTSGSQNIYQCRFRFDGDWEGLDRMAVFRAGSREVSVLLDGFGQCQIPWEVLQEAGRELYAGVFGTKGGNTVLPTIWALIGDINEGTAPGEDAKEPTPGVYEQILNKANAAEQIAQQVANDAAAGKFDGKPGPQGEPGKDGADGKDGVPGLPGTDGIDGITPHIGNNGNWWIGDTDTGRPSRGDTGAVGAVGPQGDTGTTPNIRMGNVTTLAAGADATATITGTAETPVLNIGIPKGADGKTPVKGVDYLDGAPGKSTYQSYLDTGGTLTEAQWIANLHASNPTFVDSVDKMTDQHKVYVLTKSSGGAVSINLYSKDADGFWDGYRFDSSGSETADNNAIITNYIPVTAIGDKIHVKGIATSLNGGTTYCRAVAYTSDKIQLGSAMASTSEAYWTLSGYDDNTASPSGHSC